MNYYQGQRISELLAELGICTGWSSKEAEDEGKRGDLWTNLKRVIQNHHLDLRLRGFLDESYRLRYATTKNLTRGVLDTACWFWEKSPAPGVNFIVFGEKLINNLKKRHDDVYTYVLSYYRHEVAHSLFTSKDIKQIRDLCERKKVPFPLFNMFEDAKIEHLWREKTGVNFNWVDFEDLNPDSKEVCSVFCDLIKMEGDKKQLVDYRESIGAKALSERVERIVWYYNEACKIRFDTLMVDLCVKFMMEFGIDRHVTINLVAGKDLESSIEVAEAGGKMIDGSQVMAAADGKESTGAREPFKLRNMEAGIGEQDFFSSLDADRTYKVVAEAAVLYHKFEKLVSPRKNYGKTVRATPSKRVKMRNFLRDLPRFYVGKGENEGDGPKKWVFVLDASGSMGGEPFRNAMVLLQIFNLLALRKKAEVTLLVSAGYHNKPKYIRAQLPVNMGHLNTLKAWGGIEGFDFTMRRNLDVLVAADHVLFFTDGNIVDTELDKSFFHSKGINTLAVYVGRPEMLDSMKKWFDHAVVRSSLEGIINWVVQHLGRTKT